MALLGGDLAVVRISLWCFAHKTDCRVNDLVELLQSDKSEPMHVVSQHAAQVGSLRGHGSGGWTRGEVGGCYSRPMHVVSQQAGSQIAAVQM